MLRVYDVALALVAEVAPLAAAIGRQDPDLAKQLRRSLSSVPLNIAEGSHGRGGRRGNSYQVAMGSAREALSCLETAQAWGLAGDVPASVREKFQAVIGTLHRVVHPR
jgi:four helix bundle protein